MIKPPLETLDSGLRRGDDLEAASAHPVIPAQAGIQLVRPLYNDDGSQLSLGRR